jgi:adenylylsulfate kinase
MKILIMGLAGTGKTFLGRVIANYFDAIHFDADVVRAVANDWDFSELGRMRQAVRMNVLAQDAEKQHGIAICSFIAPTERLRKAFNADLTIYCDGLPMRKYASTDKIFEPPKNPTLMYTRGNSTGQLNIILHEIMTIRGLAGDKKT